MEQKDITFPGMGKHLYRSKAVFQKAGNDGRLPGAAQVDLKNHIADPLISKQLKMPEQVVLDVRSRPQDIQIDLRSERSIWVDNTECAG